MPANVEVVLHTLCESANSSVEMKLRAIHKTIKSFKKNNVDLTAPNLVNALNAVGVKMSKSSIYNKKVRGKKNPYKVLVDEWVKYINEEKVHDAEVKENVNFTIMSNADYESIASDVVKFKIQNMYNELRSARHQINLLKDIKQLPSIEESGESLLFHNDAESPTSHWSTSVKNDSVDDISHHIETIEEFIAGTSKLAFDEDGCLIALKGIRKDDLLSDVELKQALVAALESLKGST